MTETLHKCPKCNIDESCAITPINEFKNAYTCFNCGYATSDLIVEGEFDFDSFEDTLPELYKDIKYKDEQGRVWYPHVVNIEGKGISFINGTSKEDWQWAAIKSVPLSKEDKKNPRFKGQKYKSDPTTLENFGQNGYFDSLDYLGIFEVETPQ
jgi:hypothetical protein